MATQFSGSCMTYFTYFQLYPSPTLRPMKVLVIFATVIECKQIVVIATVSRLIFRKQSTRVIGIPIHSTVHNVTHM